MANISFSKIRRIVEVLSLLAIGIWIGQQIHRTSTPNYSTSPISIPDTLEIDYSQQLRDTTPSFFQRPFSISIPPLTFQPVFYIDSGIKINKIKQVVFAKNELIVLTEAGTYTYKKPIAPWYLFSTPSVPFLRGSRFTIEKYIKAGIQYTYKKGFLPYLELGIEVNKIGLSVYASDQLGARITFKF